VAKAGQSRYRIHAGNVGHVFTPHKADSGAYPRYIAARKEVSDMTATTGEGSPAADEAHQARLRKLKFRSWHRGTREMDFVLGRFADAQLETLTGEELDQYERLLEIPDTEFLFFVTGERAVPAELDCPLLQRILVSGRSLSF
jgi:antitoxin CptB